MEARENLREQLRSLRIDRATEPPPERGSRLGVVLAIGLAALALAAGGFAAYRFAAAPLEVQVTYARAASAPASGPLLSGAGYVITREKYISIGVRVPGRIERFLVDEGDRVEVGQPLAHLDDRDYRARAGQAEAALRVARADLELARARLDRVRSLFADGVTSKEELDEAVRGEEVASARVAEAESNLRQARVDLDDTVLRSPVAGVVLAKLKGVGEVAVPGGFAGAGDLLRIADLTELRAEVDVSEVDLRNVRLGQPAEVVPDAYPDHRYRATVVKLYPQVNRQKGTLKVEVRIEDPDAALLPDMSVRVGFLAEPRTGEPAAGPTVPLAALRRGPEGVSVWVVRDGRLERRRVETGRETGGEVEIVRALEAGEAVVTSPAEGLREGAAVRVADAR